MHVKSTWVSTHPCVFAVMVPGAAVVVAIAVNSIGSSNIDTFSLVLGDGIVPPCFMFLFLSETHFTQLPRPPFALVSTL